MKSKILTILAAALALGACTTAQLNQAEAIARPLATAAVTAAASYYGVPPSDTTGS